MFLGYDTNSSFRGHIWQLELISYGQVSNDSLLKTVNFCRISGYWANYYKCYP